MEYCTNGELFDYIVAHQRLHEKQACKFYQELISGIEYIHQSGVCHRDLKPENLLLDYDKTLKIVDFGLSNMYEGDETLKTACGSPCYAAPEMIAGKRYKGLKSDIWSSGVVLFAMVCGYLPFEDPKTSNLYKKILSADYQIPKFVSSDCADFLTKILNTNPETRYSVEDIRDHPWFKQVKEKRMGGFLPGKEKMPINQDIYNMIIEQQKFDQEYSVKCIEANRHNSITATYHLIYKKQLRNSKAVSEYPTNVAGSIDRNQILSKALRTQKQEQIEEQNKNNRRGHSINIGNVNRADMNQTLPSNFYPNVLQGVHGGEESTNLNGRNDPGEVSAQKKYKLQLQADIIKLKQKYQQIGKGEELPIQQTVQQDKLRDSLNVVMTPKNLNNETVIIQDTTSQFDTVNKTIVKEPSQQSKNTSNSYNYQTNVNQNFYNTGVNFHKSSKNQSATTTETSLPNTNENYNSQPPKFTYSANGNQKAHNPQSSMYQGSTQNSKPSSWKQTIDASINLGSGTDNMRNRGYVASSINKSAIVSSNGNYQTLEPTSDNIASQFNKKTQQLFNQTITQFAQILPDKGMNKQPSKRGKASSLDQTNDHRKHNSNLINQSLNMSTIVSNGKNSHLQYGTNSLNNTQDYSYPISSVIQSTTNQSSSNNNKNIRNPNNKLNDLRLQTAAAPMDFNQNFRSVNNTSQNKNHPPPMNQTIDFFLKQQQTSKSSSYQSSNQKQSVRYGVSSINRNQTSSPKGKIPLDVNAVSLNISELYKQYSKKHHALVNNSNMLNNTTTLQFHQGNGNQNIHGSFMGGKPSGTAGGHYRAISVLDQSQLNNTVNIGSNFTGRHGSQSNHQRKSEILPPTQNNFLNQSQIVSGSQGGYQPSHISSGVGHVKQNLNNTITAYSRHQNVAKINNNTNF
eukprot:403365705